MPLGGELLNCGTGEGITLPGVAPAWVAATVENPVGAELGVANWNSGVAVGAGVVDPSNTSGVCETVGPGLGGFCQTYKNALITKHSAINPQPNPPSRNLSNKGLNFAGNFIEFIDLT